MKDKVVDIAIIGGGPAGLSAAIASSQTSLLKNKKYTIVIFEKNDSIGKSILKTGNGRCNFSNYYAYKNQGKDYNNPKFCKNVFASCESKANELGIFQNEQEPEFNIPVYNMFEQLGLTCSIEDEGRMYPYTNKATSVLDVFDYALKDTKIKICLNHEFIKIKYNKEKNLYCLFFSNNNKYFAKKIIFTTGAIKNNEFLFKYSVTKIKKALGPIKTNVEYLKNLDGIRVHAKCTIKNKLNSSKNNKNKKEIYETLHEETGELLFRRYGVSGICVFNVSRFLDKNMSQVLEIDFAPENTLEELYETLTQRYNTFKCNKQMTSKRLMAGMMLPDVVECICNYSGIDSQNLNTDNLYTLAQSIKSFELIVKSIWDEKLCQITQGGVKTDVINGKTMELKNHNNIYVAGEIIDIDGPCGGYNLHWAWSSGILAGISSI